VASKHNNDIGIMIISAKAEKLNSIFVLVCKVAEPDNEVYTTPDYSIFL